MKRAQLCNASSFVRDREGQDVEKDQIAYARCVQTPCLGVNKS